MGIEIIKEGARIIVRAQNILVLQTKDDRLLARVRAHGQFIMFPLYTDTVSIPMITHFNDAYQTYLGFDNFVVTRQVEVVVTSEIADLLRKEL